VIKEAQEKIKIEDLEWITMNVAETEARKAAVDYRIRFVPTTIINGEKMLVGVTTVKQLEDEISKFK
jgi:hypothetical protein